MKKKFMVSAIVLPGLIMTGCLSDANKDAVQNGGAKGKAGKSVNPEIANNSDPYKSNYAGPAVDLGKIRATEDLANVPYKQSPDDSASMDRAKGLSKKAITGSWAGIIPWDISQCPTSDRVNFYMDDEDDGNTSYLTSPGGAIPGGLNDGNAGNTRFVLCKVGADNFRRLQTVNYAVWNFSDGTQPCPNGGINYEQLVDNEGNSNNDSWSGCCGNNDPDYWTRSGGSMQIRFCYYPKDPNAPVNLTFPNWLSHNYGVLTEGNQDNVYVKSWGVVESDDEDGSWDGTNYNQQILVGNSYLPHSRDPLTTWNAYFNQGIIDWDWTTAGRGTFTRYMYGKIKQYP